MTFRRPSREFGGRGVVEERDVVVDREDDGFAPRETRVGGRRVRRLDQRLADAPFGRAREGLFNQRGELRAGEMDQVLGRCVRVNAVKNVKSASFSVPMRCGARRQMRGGVYRLVPGFFIRSS